MLLSFLNMRVIINGKDIYPVKHGERIIINVNAEKLKMVITDGFHFTAPLELIHRHPHVYYFKIGCIINDTQLVAGFCLLAVFYLAGFATGIFALKVLSFVPIIYFLFWYYIKRKEFIQVQFVR
jgi:hypothetical protein